MRKMPKAERQELVKAALVAHLEAYANATRASCRRPRQRVTRLALVIEPLVLLLDVSHQI
jgi:ABC-type Fe3+/spermidine/putrescine transport system ATPase subunit